MSSSAIGAKSCTLLADLWKNLIPKLSIRGGRCLIIGAILEHGKNHSPCLITLSAGRSEIVTQSGWQKRRWKQINYYELHRDMSSGCRRRSYVRLRWFVARG